MSVKIETEETTTKTRSTQLDEPQIKTILRAYLAAHWGVPESEITGEISSDYEGYYGTRANFTHVENLT